MKKQGPRMPEKGDENALDLYAMVGSALSYWEAAQDVLMDLFKWLCDDAEPIAVECYKHAPRKARDSMLREALNRYGWSLTDEEKSGIEQAIKKLDKLAATRNEIAHGHVVSPTIVHGDVTVAEGNYLLPGLSEGGWQYLTPRFHHTVETIFAFREEVRDHRWTIMEASFAMLERRQKAGQEAGPETFMQRQKALEIASGRVSPTSYGRYMKPTSEWKSNASDM